jgi:hypothetical protein
MALASMITQSPDTDPESERQQIRILRSMPVWQRIAQIDALNAMAGALPLRRFLAPIPGRLESHRLRCLAEMTNAQGESHGES